MPGVVPFCSLSTIFFCDDISTFTSALILVGLHNLMVTNLRNSNDRERRRRRGEVGGQARVIPGARKAGL